MGVLGGMGGGGGPDAPGSLPDGRMNVVSCGSSSSMASIQPCVVRGARAVRGTTQRSRHDSSGTDMRLVGADGFGALKYGFGAFLSGSPFTAPKPYHFLTEGELTSTLLVHWTKTPDLSA